ncbi:FMN-binding protein [Candidatus Kaiserbacteria bacterium]|nr:FMN-binding protein [Candidatus Kaiserbacteria bacterium]
MKKFIASTTFILAFAVFAVFQNATAQSNLIAVDSAVPTTAPATEDTSALPPKKEIATTAAPSEGKYKDGTYTGVSAYAYYGQVQVQVKIANGKIADVTFLDYPQDRGTSRQINSYAMSQLTQEAIAAQSANVNGVSGASDTSEAFKQSLTSALSQAA